MNAKYTKEILQNAVSKSNSIAGVIRILGLRQAGGTQAHISKRIKQFNIDTSHFIGKSHNKGNPARNRKPSCDILVVLPQGSLRPKRSQLKRAMKDSGIQYICDECKQEPLWNNSELKLEIDHIDGNWLNNLIENLRFICPNCHSQQESTNKPYKYASVAE